MAKSNDKPKGAGRNGNVPPPEHRWPPGVSGNPAGRSSAGKSTQQWVNLLDEQCVPRSELVKIRDDPAAPPTKVAAAERLLRMMESPDMADFQPLLDGTMDLVQLRESGVDTSMLKKIKERREVDKEGKVVAIIREVELHDRSGEEFDRVCDRTEGKPRQSLDLSGSLGMPTGVTMHVVGPRRNGQDS